MTKGNWTYQYGEVYAENGDVIARRDVDRSLHTSPVERDENLRACGAVPDLMAALEALAIYTRENCGRNPYCVPEFKTALLALGKARGQNVEDHAWMDVLGHKQTA